MGTAVKSTECIARISLDEKGLLKRAEHIEQERNIAIADLLDNNHFEPILEPPSKGPYHLILSVRDNRLVFDIDDHAGEPVHTFVLALRPFTRVVREYFHICEAYFQALGQQTPQRLEAIDMGRQGIHNRGAELLIDRLKGKIAVDHNTARRLFTLLCALQMRG